MTTALAIVKRSMRICGAVDPVAGPSTTEQADGLEALNAMLSVWSARTWTVLYRTRDANLPVPSSANSYSIGTGGDFDTARPIRIDSVAIVSGNIPYPLKERSLEDYNANVVSGQAIPEFFYYEPVFPLGLLYFPTKLGTSMTVTIDSIKPLESFTDINDDISLPPGYEEAVVFNLAKRLNPEYGSKMTLDAMQIASEGEDFLLLQSNLHRKKLSRIDPAIMGGNQGRFNVIAGR